MRVFLLFLGVFLFGALDVSGAVFSLKPGRTGGGSRFLSEMRQIWDEPMMLNGFQTRLTISMTENSVADLLAELRIRYPNLKTREGEGGVVVEIPAAEGITRLLLMRMGGVTLQFSTRLPKQLPSALWPRGLPQLAGAQARVVTEFPERGTVSVQFTMSGRAADNLALAVGQCQSAGWHDIAASPSEDGSHGGTMMMSEDGGSLIALGFTAVPGDNSVSGAMVGMRLRK